MINCCWNCKHAKEITEYDPSIMKVFDSFIHCTEDGKNLICNKMYSCYKHKGREGKNNIPAPTEELINKWKTFKLNN